MVNPITSISPAAFNPVAIEIERPVMLPDPTRQVTPTGETLDARNSETPASQAPSGTPQLPLDKALEELNNSMQAWATGMRFDIDQDAQRVVVSIIDSATGEVLRTVPSDAVIRIAKMIVQLQGNSISTTA